jgi:hypothetical protein
MAYFIRIDTGTEVAYDLIAEPVQEPSAGEPQAQEVIEQAPGEVANPADLQGKPQSMTLNFSIPSLLYNYCAFKFLGVGWNLRCMIPRFPQSLH